MTEASDLGGQPFLNQLYKDAVDVGFVMKSHKTGEEVMFCLDKEHRDTDGRGWGGLPLEYGDITHWTFKPTSDSIKRNPQIVNLEVTIFND